MYLLLAIFFISIAGLGIMLSRKIRIYPITNERGSIEIQYNHPFIPDGQMVKELARDSAKFVARSGVVTLIRLHVKTSNMLKSQYRSVKNKMHRLNKKDHGNGHTSEKVEVSKFLKLVSDYKHKIREIKHKIHEEENNP